jgi:transcriptional antiterminator RfaH
LAKHWYVIYTKAQKEEFAQTTLNQKGIEAIFLKLLLPRFSRRRKFIVPLFPNYLFVRIDLATEHWSVLWSPGVKCFVQFNDLPTPLDDKIVEYLMAHTDTQGMITARSDLKTGQEVRVCGGAFDGVVGMILNEPDAKGRVKILMQLLNRDINVELPIHMLATSWVPGQPNREPRTVTTGN